MTLLPLHLPPALAQLRPLHMPCHAAVTHVHRPGPQHAPVTPDPPTHCNTPVLVVTGGGDVAGRRCTQGACDILALKKDG
jgi:hypothetical protein